MAKLQLIFDGEVINEYDINKDEISIGRHPSNDINIDNMGISGQHAKIVKSAGEFYIEDNNSTNGTKLNGQKISRQILKHGDNIGLFKHTLRFAILSSPEASSDQDGASNGAVKEQESDATIMLSADRLDNMMSEYRSEGEEGDAKKAEVQPHLEVKSSTAVRTLQLHDKSILIGKKDGCQINTGGWFFSPAVSAIIKKDIGGSYSIRPEVKIKINTKKTNKIQLLKHNDHIFIRDTVIIFKLH